LGETYTTSANRHYTDGFASVANEQLLLNIARLANNEPAYFIQLGSFTAAYTYNGTIGTGTNSFAKTVNGGTDSVAAGVATVAASAADTTSTFNLPSLSLAYTEEPTFSFTPLSGDVVMKSLFAPLPNQVFSIIFSTWHADIALRTAVADVELVPPAPPKVASRSVAVDKSSHEPKPDSTKPSEGRPLIVSMSKIDRSTDGTTLTLTVEATPYVKGDGTVFQWQVRKNKKKDWETQPEKDWEPISDGPEPDSASDPAPLAEYSGSDKPTLMIAGVTDDMNRYRYRCVVTGPQTPPIVLKNDPRDPRYPLFLALAYELRQAQVHHVIPAPYKSTATAKLEDKDKTAAQEDEVAVINPRLSDLVTAVKAGWAVDAADSGKNSYNVYKAPAVPDTTFALQFPDETLLEPYPVLYWIIGNQYTLRCSLRSFDASLYEIAKEEKRFPTMPAFAPALATASYTTAMIAKEFAAIKLQLPAKAPPAAPIVTALLPPTYWQHKGDPYLGVNIAIGNESFNVRPILRITQYHPDYNLVEVPHSLQGKETNYIVGDFADAPESDLETPSVKNQTEFTMLAYLFNQASIDSTKLPVQQLFQVR
jgi:hypothetical protein